MNSDAPTPTPRQLNILVVDDEVGTRAALSLVLALAGHRAAFAKDGDEALALFQETDTPFDLIITDHQMARVSGLDLTRALRAKGFGGEIVVLTAFAETFDAQEYRKLDVSGIMEKPFDVAELRHWLDCINEARQLAADGQASQGRLPIVDCYLAKHK